MLADDEIGKDQRVGAPGHLRAGRFGLAHHRAHRGIGLQFAIDVQISGARARTICERLHHLVRLRVLAAALGGKAEQRHDRLGVDQSTRVLSRGGDGDLGQFHGRRDRSPRRNRRRPSGRCGRATGPRSAMMKTLETRRARGSRPDAVQGRAHRLGGGVDGAAHAAIGIARGHHQGGEIERPAGDLRRFHLRDAFGAAPFVVERGVFLERPASAPDRRTSRLRARLAGAAPISTGFTTPSRARRAAASSTRGSVPSGKTMVFLSLRARSMRPDMNSRRGFGNGRHGIRN